MLLQLKFMEKVSISVSFKFNNKIIYKKIAGDCGAVDFLRICLFKRM
jgi:hypothetical protein